MRPMEPAKAASGARVANLSKRRRRLNGSATNRMKANSSHRLTMACIHQNCADWNRPHRSIRATM